MLILSKSSVYSLAGVVGCFADGVGQVRSTQAPLGEFEGGDAYGVGADAE